MSKKDREIYTADATFGWCEIAERDPKAPLAPPKSRAAMEAERRHRQTAEAEGLAAAVEQAGTEIRTGLEAIAKALEAQYEETSEVSHEPH